MGDQPTRYRVGDYPRDAVEREWEIFVRERGTESLRHGGSVSAPSADVAYERAATLFGRYATDVWLCPARAVRRYVTHTLDERAEPAPPGSGTRGGSHDE